MNELQSLGGNRDKQELILKKQEYTVRAKQILKRTAQDIIELSQVAHEYRRDFGYQGYIEWVKTELGLSKSYGCNLLNVFKKYGSSPQCGLTSNFDSSALRLLSASSTPESAREEVQDLHDSGEHITHYMAKEITDRYKAEIADKQRALFTQEERTKKLDVAIMRQETVVEKLNQQITELKSQKPEVIEKEKIVEKAVEKIPDDYEQIKIEKVKIEKTLEREKIKVSKNEEEAKFQQRRIDSLGEKLAKITEEKDRILANHTPEMRERKANNLLVQSNNKIVEALGLLNIDSESSSWSDS